MKVRTEHNRIPQIIEEMEKLKYLTIEIGVFGEDNSFMAMLARVHEFGARIRPKAGKYLTIPSEHAKGKRAKDIKGLYRPFANGKPLNILVVDGGSSPNQYGNTVMFYLTEGVDIPERSFLRSTFDDNENKWFDYAKKLIAGLVKGNETAQTVCEKLGKRVRNDIRKAIRDKDVPQNAPVTVKNKGKDDPLVSTGKLGRSVVYKVVET